MNQLIINLLDTNEKECVFLAALLIKDWQECLFKGRRHYHMSVRRQKIIYILPHDGKGYGEWWVVRKDPIKGWRVWTPKSSRYA